MRPNLFFYFQHADLTVDYIIIDPLRGAMSLKHAIGDNVDPFL